MGISVGVWEVCRVPRCAARASGPGDGVISARHPVRVDPAGHEPVRHLRDAWARAVLPRKALVADRAGDPTPTETAATPEGAEVCRRRAPPMPRLACALRGRGAPSICSTSAPWVRTNKSRRRVRARGTRRCSPLSYSVRVAVARHSNARAGRGQRTRSSRAPNQSGANRRVPSRAPSRRACRARGSIAGGHPSGRGPASARAPRSGSCAA